jgi:hypothetical protein
MQPTHTGHRLWLRQATITLAFSLCATVAAAQPDRPTAMTAMGGAGLRGAGNIAACCGPFQPDRQLLRSAWLGGSLSRGVRERVAVDAEVTWSRLPQYRAYVQGAFAGAEYRGYASDNQISSVTLAGLLRWRAWRGVGAGIDLVGGLAAIRERRVSHLASVAFRPTPWAAPAISLDIADSQTMSAAVLGGDLERARGAFSVVAHGRVHLLVRGDMARTDLDLARHVWRAGVGVRVRF